MSVEVISWVLNQSVSRGTDRLVLLVLADHADKERWECWPGRKRLSKQANMTMRSVKRCIDNLVVLGEVKILRQGNGATKSLYRITPLVMTDAGGTACVTGTTGDTTEVPPASPGEVPPASPKPSVRTVSEPSLVERPSSTERTKRKTRIPDDFEVTDEMRQWSAGIGIRSDLDVETAKFLDHHRAKGNTFADPVAAWRGWMRRADEFAGNRSRPVAALPATQSRNMATVDRVLAQITGGAQ